MTNEEFQRLVLEKLDNLELGQHDLKDRQKNLELEQKEMHKKIDGIVEQTLKLTEFRYETKQEFKEIKSNLSRIEIATADNWSDIARLKSIR